MLLNFVVWMPQPHKHMPHLPLPVHESAFGTLPWTTWSTII
jgi:hypothetical protein